MSNPIVHVEVAGFSAPFNEFPPERPDIKDDCGPYSSEICMAAVERRAPTTGHMIAIRSRDINHKDAKGNPAPLFRIGGGQTLDELEADVHEYTHIQTTKTPMGSPAEVIHQALKAAMLRGNPCVLQILNAQKLAGNQTGVQHHFVAVGGIHTIYGYRIANGDRVPFNLVGPYWVSWASILAAQPYGLLEYRMPPPPDANTPPPVDPLAPYKAQIAALQAKIDKAKADLA